MPIRAAALDAMIAAGLTGEQIAMLVKAEIASDEAAVTARRAKAAERQRKHRARNAVSHSVTVTERDVSVTERDTPLDGPPPPAPPPPLNPPASQSSAVIPARGQSPRDELRAVLDESRAGAVLDHRSRIKAPLTAHAARLLAGKFGKCPDPNAAADTMVANGWRGFEPDWLDDRRQGRGPPARPRKTSFTDLAEQFERYGNEHPDDPPGYEIIPPFTQ